MFEYKHAPLELIEQLYNLFQGKIHRHTIDSMYMFCKCDYEKTTRLLHDMLAKEHKQRYKISNDVGHRLSNSFNLARPHLINDGHVVSGIKSNPTTHAYAGWTQ
ncbi:ORF066L [Scale drop disease virus]|nr:ORF066L [Scale drop disease virus]